jgi:hypothetical protein
MAIPKNRSIVKVDTRPYRKIAQENWNLTDEQMKGMHVHHRIPVSKGGTNDPSNLYVCSPSFHANIWHGGKYRIITNATEVARLGGLSGGSKGGTTTKKRLVGIFDPKNRGLGGRAGGRKGSITQKNLKIGIHSLSIEERQENTKRQWENHDYRRKMTEVAQKNGQKLAEEKKGIFADENLGKGAETTNNTLWMDPEHPNLGAHHFNTLRKLQKEQGYPDGKNNRVKVGIRGDKHDS